MTTTGHPTVVTSVAQLRKTLDEVRRRKKKIGLVPTMGALHEGHLSLIRASKSECDYTVVSIFVNPIQFGPGEDLQKYPHTFNADLDLLAECGAELAFVPDHDAVYPPGHTTRVEVGSVAEPLEGRCRPGHFCGVATIVLKLFNMAGADVAYFGQKDYQQALVIRQMVADLNVPIEIRVCPIIREADGLAMSSRNTYLSPKARQAALQLWKSLELAGGLIEQGQRDARSIAQRMRETILTAESVHIDYIALVDADTLAPVDTIAGRTLAALAVNIEGTRLIDNRLLEPPKE